MGVQTSFFTMGGWGAIDHFLSADVIGCFDILNHSILLKAVLHFNLIQDDHIEALIINFAKVTLLDFEKVLKSI